MNGHGGHRHTGGDGNRVRDTVRATAGLGWGGKVGWARWVGGVGVRHSGRWRWGRNCKGAWMEGPSREVGGGEGGRGESQPQKSPLLARNVLHPSVLLTWATARKRKKKHHYDGVM